MTIPLWQLIAALIGTAGLGGLLKTWLGHKRGKRKETDNVALALVTTLGRRVDKLEADLEQERARCDAELGAHRHRIVNQRTLIYSVLHIFDMPAARRKPALAAVREQIAAMEQAESHETAIIRAAPLSGGSVREMPAPWGLPVEKEQQQ